MIILPPLIPIPGLIPTDPITTNVPPLIPAPVMDEAWPLITTVPPYIPAHASSPAEPITTTLPPFMFMASLFPTSLSTTILPSNWKEASIDSQLPSIFRVPPLFMDPTHSPRFPRTRTLDCGGKCVITPKSPSLGLVSPPEPYPIFINRSFSIASGSILAISRLSLKLLAVCSLIAIVPRV